MLGLPAMSAADALADLTEISSQIEAAVLAGPNGSVMAATFPDEGRAEAVARAAGALLRAADEARGDGGEPLVQLQAATPEGSVFVVRDEQRLVAAVTGADPTVGLVFYDLKTCLRLAAEESTEKSPDKSRAKKKPAASSAGTASEKQADA
jgi:predicted regulator of Ras-like GTPase activity (Roadblock/LC7/MglB family)